MRKKVAARDIINAAGEYEVRLAFSEVMRLETALPRAGPAEKA